MCFSSDNTESSTWSSPEPVQSNTSSMEQSPPWESNRHSVSQEIPHLSCNLKVNYHVHESPPLVTILSQTNPFHTFPLYFCKTHSNIIYSPKPESFRYGYVHPPSEKISAICLLHYPNKSSPVTCLAILSVCYFMTTLKLIKVR